MKQAIYKVPNGKLLKIFLETEECKIKTVKITGDFFIYPEEKITMLEEVLRGAALVEPTIQAKPQAIIDKESPSISRKYRNSKSCPSVSCL